MNTRFIIASVFAFIPVSVIQAADVIVPHQSEQVIPSVITSPPFSWAGFYFGGQIGGFSSKISAMTRDVDIPLYPDESSKNKKWVPVEKQYMPKLSGFIGGFYTGANLEFDNGLILGVDTDILFFGQKDTKTIVHDETVESSAEEGGSEPKQVSFKLGHLSEVSKPVVRNQQEVEGNHLTFSHTLKQKWTGATRARIGFSVARMMPYISGGVAYGKFQDILSTSITGEDPFSATSDETKTMIGYTVGGGVDFAMTNNFIVRAEYRYSDFGKKKFKDTIELDYKTNDFRVGIAYKF
ncbi:porin [Bartonella henselae]|uniref:outer membrane protein n=1 Tax=Bartonella henselae TaxID=38323 RepID=UPI00043790A5|nr:outer membrane protein [Bartonella henselae]MDM9997280.1 porin family protein [Bartonella henselae]OLL38555.1 hemin-binding protein [Bartonella henselae]OLL41947.1 hemin-binding protein [Bartonella henselae]OLL45745.1 hemin-binding protein [Bartonella henselae]OLL49050.1 hemin-binding protein [Bartonella henselae]